MLAEDGHRVTLLERDASPMPESAGDAFEKWHRRGAPQVRHSHAFLAPVHNGIRDRVPELMDKLRAAGAEVFGFEQMARAVFPEPDLEPADEEIALLGVRRVTFEWVLRRHILDLGRVVFRDGALVRGLAARRNGAAPQVTGVRLALPDGGETTLAADLVVDASGRGSHLGRWLEEARRGPAARGVRALRHLLQLALLPPAQGRGGAHRGRHHRRRSRLPQVRRLPGRRRHLLHHAGRQPRRSGHGLRRPRGGLRGRRPRHPAGAGLDRSVAGRAHLQGARHGAAHEHAALLRAGRRAAGPRCRPARRCAAAPEPALRARLHAGLDARRAAGADAPRAARQTRVPSRWRSTPPSSGELLPWFEMARNSDRDAIEFGAAQRRGEDPLRAQRPDGTVDPKATMRSLVRDGLLPALREDIAVLRAFMRMMTMLDPPADLMKDPSLMQRVLASWQRRGERAPAAPRPHARRDAGGSRRRGLSR